MTHRFRFLAALLLMPAAGCALWEDFAPPVLELPDRWKETDGGAQPQPWPDDQWWRGFKSSQLSAMIEEAGRSNYDLKAAIAHVRQADAQARIAGAPLLPSVDASGVASRARTSGGSRSASAIGVTSRPRMVNAYSGGLSAAYELDFWGRNRAGAESAQALAQAGRFDAQTVRLTVTSAVANNYFDILATRERLEVAQDNLSNAEKLLESFRNRFSLGAGTALEVAQQESVVASQRALLPPLEQRLRQGINAQAILLGQMPETLQVAQGALAEIEVPRPLPGLPSELLARRPDVQRAEAELAAAHADIIAARAAFFPSIRLTADSGYESAALAQLFKPDSLFFSLAGSAAQPIFEGGRLQGRLDFDKARYEELLQLYRKTVISAFSDVENALVAARQTAAEVEAQKNAEKTARRAYELSRQQLEGGIVDITVVLNTQRVWFTVKDALVQARLANLQAAVGLYRALGGGWEKAPA